MQQIGTISAKIIALLGIAVPANTAIFCGPSNKLHMSQSHPQDYANYGADIPLILANPDYVGLNPSDGSIEYVKEYLINHEYVKVAVRVSTTGRFYARSVYVLNPSRVLRFIQQGTLKHT